MPDFTAHVLVCTNTENADDKRHCGDKGGPAVRQKFNQLLVQHKLLEKVTVSNVGCTSQHRFCDGSQGNVIVYGPRAEMGGTWYTATADDVEEIITEHLINGRIVERLRNNERVVKFS
jgi:(2Fe-2S) ferredoxin